MNTTKKLLLAAGIFFQLSASLFADNWPQAFLVYGGGSDAAVAAQSVLANANSIGSQNAYTIAKNIGTDEAWAVGRFMANSKKHMFKSPLQDADVIAAGQEIISAAVRSVPVVAPVARQEQQSQQEQPSSGWNSWMSRSSAPAISSADVQKAQQAQKQADVAAAAASNQALANLVNSGATGLDLYKGYIDLNFSLLQQAINGIVDPAVQQQVLSYAQRQLSGMKASVAASRNKNYSLGRMNSKKVSKKRK